MCTWFVCVCVVKHSVDLSAGMGPQLPIHDAAAQSDVSAIQALLNAKSAIINATNPDGSTPLALAATRGHVDTVALLLAAGADDRIARPGSKFLPLHAAVANNYVDVVKLLSEKGHSWSTLNAATTDGDRWDTPLDVARSFQRTELEVYLRDKGARTYQEGSGCSLQ